MIDLVPLGLACYAAGALWQDLADWRKHGVTDLRYTALLLLILGPGLLAYAALERHPLWAALAGAPALTSGVMLVIKARDRLRTRWRW